MDAAKAKQLETENEELKTKLAESERESQSNRDAALKLASDSLVESQLKSVENLPEKSRERIQKRLSERAIVKDGKVDEDGIKTAVEAAVKDEADYLVSLGLENVTDLGPSGKKTESDEPDEKDDEKYQEGLKKTFESLGMSETTATIAAKGRN